ncbi:hypothetical protein VTK56DRAFT_365 [Thermocarpiscus australiensis]
MTLSCLPSLRKQLLSNDQSHRGEPTLTFPEIRGHTGAAAQLSLPAVPDPLGASLLRQDGHTSGGLVAVKKASQPKMTASFP